MGLQGDGSCSGLDSRCMLTVSTFWAKHPKSVSTAVTSFLIQPGHPVDPVLQHLHPWPLTAVTFTWPHLTQEASLGVLPIMITPMLLAAFNSLNFWITHSFTRLVVFSQSINSMKAEHIYLSNCVISQTKIPNCGAAGLTRWLRALGCSLRRLGFSSQHPQLSATPVPGALALSSDLHTPSTHTDIGKIPLHLVNK